MRRLVEGEPIIVEQPSIPIAGVWAVPVWRGQPPRSATFVRYSDKSYMHDECVVQYTNNVYTVKCNTHRVSPVFRYAWMWRMHKVRSAITRRWWLVRQGRQFVQ